MRETTTTKLLRLRRERDLLQAQIDELEAQIKDMMGEQEKMPYQGVTYTWVHIESHPLDSKRLKAERPDIAAEYTTTVKSRRFSISV